MNRKTKKEKRVRNSRREEEKKKQIRRMWRKRRKRRGCSMRMEKRKNRRVSSDDINIKFFCQMRFLNTLVIIF